MEAHKKLLLANKAWVQEKLQMRPDYFARMSNSQSPNFLWIGCADSRVPAEEITGTEPGELFVHRNVANLVVHTDLNMLTVLQYAVNVLKVGHIIVCGHYDCGGIRSAMTNRDFGLIINKWLRNIKDVYRVHRNELNAIHDHEDRQRKLVELNVIEQINHLAETSIVQTAWHQHQKPYLHGWIYDVRVGLLKELITTKPNDPIDELYRFDMDELST